MLQILNNNIKVKEIQSKFHLSSSTLVQKILNHPSWDKSLNYCSKSSNLLMPMLLSKHLEMIKKWNGVEDGGFEYHFDCKYRERIFEGGHMISNLLFWYDQYDHATEYGTKARDLLLSDRLACGIDPFIEHCEEIGLVMYVARMMWEKDICEMTLSILDEIDLPAFNECECM